MGRIIESARSLLEPWIGGLEVNLNLVSRWTIASSLQRVQCSPSPHEPTQLLSLEATELALLFASSERARHFPTFRNSSYGDRTILDGAPPGNRAVED